MRFASAGIYAEKQKENISFQLGAMLLNKQDKQIHWNVAAKAHDDYLDTKINWSNSGTATFCGELSSQSKFIKTEKSCQMPTYIQPDPLIHE